ncbi:hypothetical protein Tco_1100025 [Tanacetum coccineum]
MFIKYSTRLIPPKKSRGKGSQGKKSADTSKLASVEVSNESDSKPVRKRTGSRRVIKKKVLISAEDNIILEPDAALELRKSMSLTEAAEEEAARQVYATHERIKISPDSSHKQKGIRTLTAKEQLVADIMQALKASRKSSRSQPHVGGSSKGTGTKPEVLDESIGILSTSHEGTGTKPGDPDKVQEENVDEEIDWVYSNEEEEKKDDDDDDKSIDIEETNDEETDDEFVRGDEYVQENVDEEMKDAEVDVTRNGDQQMTDTTKADAEKSEEVKDDNKKAELPPSSSSLSVSSGFGNQFLNLSSDKSIVGNLKDTTDAEINSLLDVQIQQEILHIQSPSILTVPVSVISEPAVLSPIPEIPTVTSTTTPPPHYVSTISHVLQHTTTPIPTPPITTVAPAVTTILDPLPAIIQRVSVLEKDVQELKEVDHTTTHLALLRSEIPSAVNAYLGSSLGDALQMVLQKHTEELKQ